MQQLLSSLNKYLIVEAHVDCYSKTLADVPVALMTDGQVFV
jgi:hypothetical protein